MATEIENIEERISKLEDELEGLQEQRDEILKVTDEEYALLSLLHQKVHRHVENEGGLELISVTSWDGGEVAAFCPYPSKAKWLRHVIGELYAVFKETGYWEKITRISLDVTREEKKDD